MTISYIGARSRYTSRGIRQADFSYTEKEETLAMRVFDFLRNIKGWDIDTGVYGWAGCEVEDRDEYDELVRDYKKAKKMLTACMKYGF